MNGPTPTAPKPLGYEELLLAHSWRYQAWHVVDSADDAPLDHCCYQSSIWSSSSQTFARRRATTQGHSAQQPPQVGA